MMNKIALVFVGTSKYADFFPLWYEGVSNYLFNEGSCEKTVYAFTDRVDEEYFKHDDVVVCGISHVPWPWVTLSRFSYIDQTIDDMRKKGITHTLFLDADLFPQENVFFSQVFNKLKPLTGVCHPGKISNPDWHAFVQDEATTASVHSFNEDLESQIYHQGCLWGGAIDEVAEMCEQLVANIEKDNAAGVMPDWHDESHMNYWFLKNYEKVHTLPSSFAFPDQKFWHNTLGEANMTPVMLHIDKPHGEYPRFKGAAPDGSQSIVEATWNVLRKTGIKYPFRCLTCGHTDQRPITEQLLQEWFFTPVAAFSEELRATIPAGQTHAAICEKCINSQDDVTKVY